jgi:hypothetical protein
MVHDPLSTALVTALDMASHIGGAAVKDMREDPVLIWPQWISVLIVPHVFFDNICYL